MTRTTFQTPRLRRPVLVVDHAGWDYRAVSSAARAAGLLPQAVPNPGRARVHLRGDAPFDGLLVPGALGLDEIEALVREARRRRPGLRIVVLARDARRAREIEARLGRSDEGDRSTDVVWGETEHAIHERLERAFDGALDAARPRSGPTNWGNAA